LSVLSRVDEGDKNLQAIILATSRFAFAARSEPRLSIKAVLRELARQIYDVITKLASYTQMKIALIIPDVKGIPLT
jgi:superfamily II DNA/RNA helicase